VFYHRAAGRFFRHNKALNCLCSISMGKQVAHPSASVSVCSQRGGSPLQVIVLRLVAEGNCVAVKRGGEQP
jgi:hypothetical protein